MRSARDTIHSSGSAGAKQGLFSEQWQRPELYDRFYPRTLDPTRTLGEAAE